MARMKQLRAEKAKESIAKQKAQQMADQRGLGQAGDVRRESEHQARTGAEQEPPQSAVSYSNPGKERQDGKTKHRLHLGEEIPAETFLPERKAKALLTACECPTYCSQCSAALTEQLLCTMWRKKKILHHIARPKPFLPLRTLCHLSYQARTRVQRVAVKA